MRTLLIFFPIKKQVDWRTKMRQLIWKPFFFFFKYDTRILKLGRSTFPRTSALDANICIYIYRYMMRFLIKSRPLVMHIFATSLLNHQLESRQRQFQFVSSVKVMPTYQPAPLYGTLTSHGQQKPHIKKSRIRPFLSV